MLGIHIIAYNVLLNLALFYYCGNVAYIPIKKSVNYKYSLK